MEHLSNDHEDHLNQQKNSHKLCSETGYPVLSLSENQWKLRVSQSGIRQVNSADPARQVWLSNLL